MPLIKLLGRLSDMLLFSVIAVWDVIESAVFVAGVFVCFMLPVEWPYKFLYLGIWLCSTYAISKLISKLDEHRRKVR